MENPLPFGVRRDSAKLFEAQTVDSQLRSLRCASPDLSRLIRDLEIKIDFEVCLLAGTYHNEHGDYGPYACHACGGDDESPCDHCSGRRFVTVDDVVEWVWRLR